LLRSTPISIIPLPDKDAAPGSPAHLGAYQEFPTRATVMALYPDTSCFYRAEVIASPKDIQGRVSRSIDRVESVRTVLTRSRYRPLEPRTTNSNLKTTTTRNTWSRQQRSWNGLAHDTYRRPDVPHAFTFYFVIIVSDKRAP
jgi:SGF29 tudor-like domain